MLEPKFIAFDCESGDTTHDGSLLTVYFIVLDKDFNEIDTLDLKVCPNDRIYQVKASALTVNKIDLIEHDKVAITYSEAGQKLRSFLVEHSQDKKIKLIPIGHRVSFDILFICDKLISMKMWDQYCSYRVQDTGCIAQYLRDKGILPHDLRGSLESLVAYYGLGPYEYHTANGDTRATIAVLKEMLKA